MGIAASTIGISASTFKKDLSNTIALLTFLVVGCLR